MRPFYVPGSNDRGHIVFVLCFFCLLSTLTFAITFEPLKVETSYLGMHTPLIMPFQIASR